MSLSPGHKSDWHFKILFSVACLVSKSSLQIQVASDEFTPREHIGTEHSYQQINVCWLKEQINPHLY